MLLTDVDIAPTAKGYSIRPKRAFHMELHVDHTVQVSAVISSGVYPLSEIVVDTTNDTVSFYTDTNVNILTVGSKVGTETIIDDVVISVNGT